MANVDVVHIPADNHPLQAQVVFVSGMTVAQVLEQSGLLSKHPELCHMPVGIFSRMVSLDTPVKSGDRVEIYRPLTLDPMETRRRRAKKK